MKHSEWSKSQLSELRKAALAAVAKAFPSKAGGTRYGAAVLTAGGRLYSSGQYSSFNHSTNIHAEQAALLMAAAAGEADVVALSLACTQPGAVARPCGMCRQVMLEHATRTGRDFAVVMFGPKGKPEIASVSDLLPYSWSAASLSASGSDGETRTVNIAIESTKPNAISINPGDLLVLKGGHMALVWDPVFYRDLFLVKVKYSKGPESGQWTKWPHSFTDNQNYLQWLERSGQRSLGPHGGPGAFLGPVDYQGIFPARPLGEFLESAPRGLIHLLGEANIPLSSVVVSGSRAVGLERPGSDWDVVVRLNPAAVRTLRSRARELVEKGAIAIPDASGTWRRLSSVFPGGSQSLVDQERFIDTIQTDGTRVALIFLPEEPEGRLLDEEWNSCGRFETVGIVVDGSKAVYKRAVFGMRDADGRDLTIASYHKTANLVVDGDVLAVSGWLCERGTERLLVQMSPDTDVIVWLPHEMWS